MALWSFASQGGATRKGENSTPCRGSGMSRVHPGRNIGWCRANQAAHRGMEVARRNPGERGGEACGARPHDSRPVIPVIGMQIRKGKTWKRISRRPWRRYRRDARQSNVRNRAARSGRDGCGAPRSTDRVRGCEGVSPIVRPLRIRSGGESVPDPASVTSCLGAGWKPFAT